MNRSRLSAPDRWSDIAARIAAVLDEGGKVFPESGVALMHQALKDVHGELDVGALRSAFLDLVGANPTSAHAAALTFALDEVMNVTDLDDTMTVFERYPGLWLACTELAASRPLQYTERTRILHTDALYSYYRNSVLAAEKNAGLEAAIHVVSSNEFLTNTDLGRWVGENALLALIRERLSRRPADLRRLSQQFPSMKHLVRKVDSLLGKDATQMPGSDG